MVKLVAVNTKVALVVNGVPVVADVEATMFPSSLMFSYTNPYEVAEVATCAVLLNGQPLMLDADDEDKVFDALVDAVNAMDA